MIATAMVIVFSIWQGAYNVDPHHWGLMLSNAKDLHDGLYPYKDIFIQYGVLTTVLQALAYGAGQNMLSLIVITALLYAIGLLLVYLIALHVSGNQTIALYIYICLALFHPLAIYPWANYIAFPFLMAGIYFSIRVTNTQANFSKNVLAGIFFGLTILSREGLALAVVLYIAISYGLDFYLHRNIKITSINYALLLLGLFLPLFIFIAYLNNHGLVTYWSNLLIRLPKIYIEESFSSQTTFILQTLFSSIYTGYRYFDIRWILMSFVIFSCVITIFSFFIRQSKPSLSKKKIIIAIALLCLLLVSVQLLETFKVSSRDEIWLITSFVVLLGLLWLCIFSRLDRNQKKIDLNLGPVKLAFASLLLLSSALHLSEIFRIATGSAVGIIVLFTYLSSRGFVKPFFVVLASWLALTATYGNRGNYFFPTWEIISKSNLVESPEILYGQVWPIETISHYQFLDKILGEIQSLPCNIKYQKNNTKDPLLKVMSPFKQIQLAPFETSEKMSALRPDLDAKSLISQAQKIIIFENFKKDEPITAEQIPRGFSIYVELVVPDQSFMPRNQKLAIFIPTACLSR